jgi:thymidine phosphorylase
MVRAQGGDPDAPLPGAREFTVVHAESDGVVTGLDAMAVGVAAWRLGAGRARKEDPVSAGAGITLQAKPGDKVHHGDAVMTLFTDDHARIALALEALEGAVTIGPEGSTIERLPLILDRLT